MEMLLYLHHTLNVKKGFCSATTTIINMVLGVIVHTYRNIAQNDKRKELPHNKFALYSNIGFRKSILEENEYTLIKEKVGSSTNENITVIGIILGSIYAKKY